MAMAENAGTHSRASLLADVKAATTTQLCGVLRK
eukprot:CAMPEP_0197638708 /NCGR_PEP_ID=MMETSP1338-20131121/13565_1 /TAXON_ID=43686 ORGANISM="Pelagodinium beii, Strain RCC1491" /NCGR_SAMPLE_ID=MMETSP1338 /ASSEMBLY_ACC=CAM_ASM_000754 /LENGTH=33 /DNA_ID= /DNA_START= /DNA_END= /DNA_ORIENTATION=